MPLWLRADVRTRAHQACTHTHEVRERASYRPFEDSVPWWPRVDVRERTRRAHTQRKRKSQHSAHSRSNNSTTISQEQQTGSTAVEAARSSGGGAAAGVASYERASEPLIVRLMTPCLGGCALFGFVTCSCVVCWRFLATIRTHLVMYVLIAHEWITLLNGCMCCCVVFLLLLQNTCVMKNSK